MINLAALIQDITVGEQVASQLIADDAAIKAGQPASATVPLSLYGHQGTLSILWNPSGSGLQPAQVAQSGTTVQPPAGQVPIGSSAGVPIQIGNSSNGLGG